jgi:hypothetical protein
MGRKADDPEVERTKKRVPYAVKEAANGDVRVNSAERLFRAGGFGDDPCEDQGRC